MKWREMLPKFHPLYKEPEPVLDFSFCETATAGPQTRWHIRPLTDRGRKLGGGADTPALCGVKVSWDLSTPINYHHLRHCCAKCAVEYRHKTNS